MLCLLKGSAWMDAGWREPSKRPLARAIVRPFGAFAIPQAASVAIHARRETRVCRRCRVRSAHTLSPSGSHGSDQVTTSGLSAEAGAWVDADAAPRTSAPISRRASNGWR